MSDFLYNLIMDVEKLLNTIIQAGTMLIESGAEINRVEETMVRMCQNYDEVDYADSYVTLTGIMFSLTVNNETKTRISRVRTGEVNLDRIDKINDLSRRACKEKLSVDELARQLDEIKGQTRYSFFVTTLFGAVGAAGFALFFDGNLLEMLICFFLGILIRVCGRVFSRYHLNTFLNTALCAGLAAFAVMWIHSLIPSTNADILLISGFMLLVPGLAITNAIRDTIAGDYISGGARATDAFLCAVSIAIGAGFVVYFWM